MKNLVLYKLYAWSILPLAMSSLHTEPTRMQNYPANQTSYRSNGVAQDSQVGQVSNMPSTPHLMDQQVRKFLYLQENDLKEVMKAYKQSSNPNLRDWSLWQQLPFITVLSKEIEQHVPPVLKAIIAKFYINSTITVDNEVLTSLGLNQTQLKRLWDELLLHGYINDEGQLQPVFQALGEPDAMSLSEEFIPYRNFLHKHFKHLLSASLFPSDTHQCCVPGTPDLIAVYDHCQGEQVFKIQWGKVYKKLTEDFERFKRIILEVSIDMLEGRLEAPTSTSANCFLYIHSQKSYKREHLLPYISPPMLQLLYQQLIEKTTQDERKKLAAELRQVQHLREKLNIYADRFSRIETFIRLYDQYKTLYAAYSQSSTDLVLLQQYLKQVLLIIALNQYPFRKRFASFPGQDVSYLYEDDDSTSGYSYLKVLFYALDHGWLSKDTVLYDPFFGSGSLACLTQLFPSKYTVATELMLQTSGSSAHGWYIELEKNLREFNQSVIRTFRNVFSGLETWAEQYPNTLFGNVLYVQADAREVLKKKVFKLFSQRDYKVYSDEGLPSTSLHQQVTRQHFSLKEQPVRLIVANPPWGISTTTIYQNDIEAFVFFFKGLLPRLHTILAHNQSGIVAHVPGYWIKVICALYQLENFSEFAELFFAQRAQDPYLVAKEQKRSQAQASELSSLHCLKIQQQHLSSLKTLFYELKGVFNGASPQFSVEALDEKLLVLKKQR